MERLKVLAFATATGRIGHVLLLGERLLDWGISNHASKSPERAMKHAEKLITDFTPDVVVTEDIPATSTKGQKTRQIKDAIASVAECATLLTIKAKHFQEFANKYEEAERLAARFPEMSPWVPKRRKLWDTEPRTTVLFEALALAIVAMEP
jgi:ribosomal protein L17